MGPANSLSTRSLFQRLSWAGPSAAVRLPREGHKQDHTARTAPRAYLLRVL